MSKHTPGPWKAFSGKATTGVARESTADIGLIAEVNRDRHEANANARLIAAAPEMLEALRNLVWLGEEMLSFDGVNGETAKQIKERAVAAIAKAEDRS